MQPRSRIETIAIIGLGLMGTSLALACRRRFPKTKIYGISRRRSTLSQLKKKRAIHQGFLRVEDGVRDADLIVVCTPVDTFPACAKRIRRGAKPGALVTDVGSVKGEVQKIFNSRTRGTIHFIGAHPMVGSHQRGTAAARADLYESGFTFVVRARGQNRKAFRAVSRFWKRLSRHIYIVDAKAHDDLVADISHLPHAVAAAVMHAVSPRSLKYSGRGFLDSTRIAAGHPSVWAPIFFYNRRPLIRAIRRQERELKRLRRLLDKGLSPIKLHSYLKKASRKRSQISF